MRARSILTFLFARLRLQSVLSASARHSDSSRPNLVESYANELECAITDTFSDFVGFIGGYRGLCGFLIPFLALWPAAANKMALEIRLKKHYVVVSLDKRAVSLAGQSDDVVKSFVAFCEIRTI